MKFLHIEGVKCTSGKCNGASVVGGVFGATHKIHMLFDAEQGDIERRNKDDVVKPDFGSGQQDYLYAANAFDRSLGRGRAIPEDNKWRWIGI